MDKKIVYLVVSGEYSDYTVHAGFTNESRANEYKDAICADDVEAMELDPPDDLIRYPKGYGAWVVWMHKDGNCENSPRRTDIRNLNDTSLRVTHAHATSGYVFYVVAANMEHAVKIANEKRVQMIANNEWIDSYPDWYRITFLPQKSKEEQFQDKFKELENLAK